MIDARFPQSHILHHHVGSAINHFIWSSETSADLHLSNFSSHYFHLSRPLVMATTGNHFGAVEIGDCKILQTTEWSTSSFKRNSACSSCTPLLEGSMREFRNHNLVPDVSFLHFATAAHLRREHFWCHGFSTDRVLGHSSSIASSVIPWCWVHFTLQGILTCGVHAWCVKQRSTLSGKNWDHSIIHLCLHFHWLMLLAHQRCQCNRLSPDCIIWDGACHSSHC